MCATVETNETSLPATSTSTALGATPEMDLLQQGQHIQILPSLPDRRIAAVALFGGGVAGISTVIPGVEAGTFTTMTAIAIMIRAIAYRIASRIASRIARIARAVARGNRCGGTGIREMSGILRGGTATSDVSCQGNTTHI